MTGPLPTVVVIAKECRPGRVKTRLTPPLTPQEAASVAEASLVQTLRAMLDVPASRHVLLFDGHRTPVGAEPWEVMPQASGPLDERLAEAFDALEGPVLLVGMDTPQLDATRLAEAVRGWETDALFGPAADGGFWALGMREPRGDLIRGVVMSTDGTGAAQRHRLAEAGLTVTDLWQLLDMDTVDDLRAILDACARTPFREVAEIALEAADARAAESAR